MNRISHDISPKAIGDDIVIICKHTGEPEVAKILEIINYGGSNVFLVKIYGNSHVNFTLKVNPNLWWIV